NKKDWSEDEFEGYVGEPDGQQEEGREGESDDGQLESEGENADRLEIGGECEVGEASNLPPYSHTPGCNYPCDNATAFEFFSMLLTDPDKPLCRPIHLDTISLLDRKSMVGHVLSRDRFSLILKFLHLNGNSLYILRGQPGCLHSSKYGRLQGEALFIQDLPKKPTKWGIKAYVLADSRTGYVYNWRLYTGEDEALDVGDKGYPHAVV
ncbi:hypothetical protein GBAR_LOCUS12809, partial [Geodia barretti]